MCISLEQQLRESQRFLVCGIIENDPNGPRRYADWFDAASAREAEDMARMEVRSMTAQGRRGNLWVAGVYQLDISLGQGSDEDYATIKQRDNYATYVDPDQTDEIRY